MEHAWLFESLAVTLAEIDFHDPALADRADARERGVRLELRPLETGRDGSVYASPALGLAPAVCRIDLLESAPGAADRMHWHPVMHRGEPGERAFDRDIPADPLEWLRARLHDVGGLTSSASPTDVTAVAARSDDIVAVARTALARAREPWPEIEHDERGMASS